MRTSARAGAIVLGVLVLASPAPARAQTDTVNCGAGGTIAQALARKLVGRPLVLNIRGVCVENIVITADDVTIRGRNLSDVIRPANAEQATIRIDGGRRILFDRMTIEGGEGAVVGLRGATFDIARSRITGGTRFGVIASYGATGTLHESLVNLVNGNGVVAANGGTMIVTGSRVVDNTANGIVGFLNGVVRVGQDIEGSPAASPVVVRRNGEAGIVATDSSSLIVVATTIEDNTRQGVVAARASSARIGAGAGGLLAPATIRGNGEDGVTAYQSSQALVQGGTVANNTGTGIAAVAGSAVTVAGATVSGNGGRGVTVTEGSTARIGVNDTFTSLVPATIQSNEGDGVGVFTGSSAVIGGTTIKLNGGHGINVVHATFRTLGSNTIELNTMHGVSLSAGASLHQATPSFDIPTSRDFVQDNTRAGVSAFNGAVIDYRVVTIQRNGEHGLVLSLKSSAALSTATIADNTATGSGDGIRLSLGSSILFRTDGTTTISGHGGTGLECFDTESSFAGTPTFSGNEVDLGEVCTGFGGLG